MKAVWYGRVSSLGQVEDGSSLATQQEKCEAAIKARGWELGGDYVDAGISGAKEDRPEWQRMLADCRAGKAQALVVASLDRMARNARHAIAVTDELERLGVTVVILRENIDLSTAAGRMMRTVLAGVAEMERDLIRERSITGQRAKSRRQQWPGGQPPYGWRLDGKGREAQPAPDEDERQAIKLMVDWVTREGASTGLVAKRLGELGIRTRTGTPWNYAVVRKMLRNPALWNGEHHWGLNGVGDNGRYYKSQTKAGKPAHGEPVLIRLPEPPLTRPEFDQLQQALDRAPRAGAKQPDEVTQMLSGRVFGECGGHYLGVRVKERQGYRAIYRCQSRRRPKAGQERCSCVQVHAAKLDAAVWQAVTAKLGSRETLEALAAEWLRVGTAEDPGSVEVVARKLREQVAKLERAIERVKDDVLFADDPEDARETLARLRSQLQDTRQKLEAAQVVDPAARANAQQLTDLAQLADRAADRLASMPPAQRRELVGLLQIEVDVIGPVVAGMPEAFFIRGVLDPRSNQ